MLYIILLLSLGALGYYYMVLNPSQKVSQLQKLLLTITSINPTFISTGGSSSRSRSWTSTKQKTRQTKGKLWFINEDRRRWEQQEGRQATNNSRTGINEGNSTTTCAHSQKDQKSESSWAPKRR
jgi:hypothetical protein